ncbi:MAG: class I SAM-dependent methyltransferase [Gallionella sp.]
MKLPDLSNMMNVGQLRHIQAHYESADYCNPDAVVGAFLSAQQKLACMVRGKLSMSRLRANPFYHYVLARTKYYDEVFLDAVYGSVNCIVNIGCGSDTRAYRFAHILKQKGVTVLECDQAHAIYAKQRIAQKHWPTDHIRYVPLDLNDTEWPNFAKLLDEKSQEPVLVMMEGVSPYISKESFEAFLGLLASKLDARSLLAYDFKIAGTVDGFGQSARVRQPFRLPALREEVTTYHGALGFQIQHMERSAELTRRLLPEADLLFDEDCLLRITPA